MGGMNNAVGSATMREEQELSVEAQVAVAAAREAGTPGIVPFVDNGLIGPLVEAFGLLSSADATDKRDR